MKILDLLDSVKNIINNIQPKKNQGDNGNAQGDRGGCSNCGMKLKSGAKFCSGCGASVDGNVAQKLPSLPNVPICKQSKRREEYEGTIYKCSNCGGTITKTTAICPECGITITGRSAVASVQQFSRQLMEIEESRKPVRFFRQAEVNVADTKKLSLIRSFPIPNSIDDILEFITLATANIDVALSRNTWGNRTKTSRGGQETKATISRTISNAWVSKMQQAYQKAEVIFSDDPIFKKIQKIYFDKMKELKIKV